MKDWLILICIGIVAVFAFRERDRWMPQKAAAAATVSGERPSPARQENSAPQVPSQPPQPPPAEEQLAPNSSGKTELAALVGQSQRAALAKYPSLGEAASEMNIRFNYRYKRLLAEYSPRLQDPAWPVQLADECAQAAGVRPVGAPSTPPPPKPVNPARAVAMPPRPVASPNVPARSIRVSPPAPVPAQTLVFHPAAASAPLTPLAANPASPAAPAASSALPFVTLDAVNQSSGNSYRYHWESYYGWYDISYRQSVGISITLRNLARTPETVNVRWIFFARNADNNTRFIFAASGKELDLAPGQSHSFAADSPLLQNRETNYGWIGERYMYGSRYEGWLVQLMERDTNRLIKQTGSSGYLEDLAKRSEFASVLEDYRSRLSGRGGTGL